MEYISCGKLEIKTDAEKGRVTGYAAYYNNVDSAMDIIQQGAFSEIKRNIKMLYQHDSARLLGTWDTVYEDSKGLIVEGSINMQTSLGRDVYELCKAGDLSDMSVGFKTVDADYDEGRVRVIRKADLYEVSLVTFPANSMAKITSVKSDDIQTERDFEHFLKRAGYSNRAAKIITSHGYKAFMDKKSMGDDGGDNNQDSDKILNMLSDLKKCL